MYLSIDIMVHHSGEGTWQIRVWARAGRTSHIHRTKSREGKKQGPQDPTGLVLSLLVRRHHPNGSRPVVHNLWVETPFGVKLPFHVGHISVRLQTVKEEGRGFMRAMIRWTR